MNVPIKWLRDYVDIPNNLKDFTDKMSMIGHLLDKTIVTDNDTVIDLELRGNRSDTFSILGIARDSHACYGGRFDIPKLNFALPKTVYDKFKVEVKTDKVYRFYSCFIEDVEIGPSPEWMQDRLKNYGLDPINNIVDITNFVMIETGMPMHAFDMDRMDGKQLILRQAENKEKTITFDGSELTLCDEDIVFASENNTILGLAGVIGGKNSGIMPNTKNVLLECAAYDRVTIRKTMRRYGIQTEAGLRHSHDLPSSECDFALQRAASLIAELLGENILVGIDNFYPNKNIRKEITFDVNETKRLGGVVVNIDKQKEILENLEFTCEKIDENILKVSVPLFRTDIFEEADLVEEVLRIWGYENIPATILSDSIPNPITQEDLVYEEKSRDLLVSMGMNEVITVPMTTREKMEKALEPKKDLAINLVNPSSSEHTTMRVSLYVGLLEAAKKLLERGDEKVSFFEVGKIYHKKDQEIQQKPHKADFPYIELRKVAGLLTSKKNEYDFFSIKGILEEYLNQLLIKNVDYVKFDHPQFEYAAKIQQNNLEIGIVGKLKKEITQNSFDIKPDVYAFTISVDQIVEAKKTPISYMPYSQYPAVKQDMSVIVNQDIIAAELLNSIRNYNDLIRNVEIADVYEKDNQKSILFKITYQSKDKTLSTDEVNSLHQKIEEELENKFKATISGRDKFERKTVDNTVPEKFILAAEILSIDKHPDADRLVVTQVNAGDSKYQIVTGADNINVGDIVPIALPGTSVPGLKNEDGSPVVMKVAKLRGIESHGMMLADDELGIGHDHSGIRILDKEKYKIGDKINPEDLVR